MLYTIERRKGRHYGSLVTWYELRKYTGRSKITGCLLNGETIDSFDTLKEAKDFCRANNIIAKTV